MEMCLGTLYSIVLKLHSTKLTVCVSSRQISFHSKNHEENKQTNVDPLKRPLYNNDEQSSSF